MDPALEQRVVALRQKILSEDYNPTTDEVKEALTYLKAKRGTAATRKAETVQPTLDLDALFSEPSESKPN